MFTLSNSRGHFFCQHWNRTWAACISGICLNQRTTLPPSNLFTLKWKNMNIWRHLCTEHLQCHRNVYSRANNELDGPNELDDARCTESVSQSYKVSEHTLLLCNVSHYFFFEGICQISHFIIIISDSVFKTKIKACFDMFWSLKVNDCLNHSSVIYVSSIRASNQIGNVILLPLWTHSTGVGMFLSLYMMH